ncbi:MAG: hypothetical protein DBX59_09255 [Bacillota bacterium]|nr:MAG: hypothetical protein DBX59_09255 [Bacillota bacterium]
MKKIIAIALALVCVFALAACQHRPSNAITVVFDGAGGVTATNKTEVTMEITAGSDFQEPTFTRDGYIFVGWDTDITELTQSCTVKAVWAAENSVRNKIIYDSDGGSAYMGREFYLYVGAEIPALFKPSRGSDKFLGWYLGDKKVEKGEIWQQQETVEITLKAKWSKATKIVFDSDGGLACTSIYLNDGEAIPVLPKPTKGYGSEAAGDNDYRFLGWYYNNAKVEEGAIWQSPEEDEIVFVAKWEKMWTDNY